jgi:hypothetical protein
MTIKINQKINIFISKFEFISQVFKYISITSITSFIKKGSNIATEASITQKNITIKINFLELFFVYLLRTFFNISLSVIVTDIIINYFIIIIYTTILSSGL